jgi:30S ribosomal protein S31
VAAIVEVEGSVERAAASRYPGRVAAGCVGLSAAEEMAHWTRRVLPMGKGDRRSKRGKIFRGTFGKRRIKPKKRKKAVATTA